MANEEIEFSDLLKDHIQTLQQQHDKQIQQALSNEAKMREIDKSNYRVDLNRMKFIKVEQQQDEE